MVAFSLKPKLYMKKPESNWRILFYRIGFSKGFNRLILISLFANIVIYCLVWNEQKLS